MAVASNPLLQISTPLGATGKAQPTAINPASKVADGGNDGGSSFAQVYAREHKAVPQKTAALSTARVATHLAGNDKKPAVAAQSKDDKPAVADSGKRSPVTKADKPCTDKADSAKVAQSDDDVQVSEQPDDVKAASDKASDDQALAQASSEDVAAPVAVITDPTVATAPVAAPVVDPSTLPQPVVDPAQLQAAVQTPAPAPADTFDPAADPLADMPMLRMALEQSAKDQGTTSVHARIEGSPAQAATDPAADASFAEAMGAMVDKQAVTDSSAGSDTDGLSAIGELKAGVGTDKGDARVDDLSSHLGQLNQAVGGKGAAAATPPAQPLNMQQNGWSEGLVNRVMYLSSQNLKSADIQLHPLELGRLDIRVDVTPDQQTQITFHSAHLGVREALDSQQNRLRDMLAQQGLTQVDVNVSDQSRQSQQQQQQAQAHGSQGSGNAQARGGMGVDEGDDVSAVAAAAANQTVIGSSLVDYYA
jgi:flagellar hook-length control protein FliK